jgi:hypothetical protein
VRAASIAILASATIAAIAYRASADEPKRLVTWERYVRLPILDEGHDIAVANGATNPVLKGTGSYTDERDLMLIEWGTAVSLECVARTCFCVVMDDDSIAIGSGATCGDVADSNATIPDSTSGNSCFQVPAGGRVDFILTRDHWSGLGAISSSSPAGYRTGYCASTDATPYYPCDANDDCVTSAGATGTCTVPSGGAGFESVSGAFLVHETASGAATTCSIRKDI